MLKPWQFLKKAAELGRIPHALLFYGPASQEKKSSALKFIELINGQNIGKALNPDLFIVEPQENQEIEISQIRELQAKLSLKSYSSPFKSVIIDKAHCLNQQAQSAFLKLLEEPKGPTIFILITEYPEVLLPTILSRVERLGFYSPAKKSCSQKEIKVISSVLGSDLAGKFQYAKELSEKENLKEVLESWIQYFRQAFLSDVGQDKTLKVLKQLQTVHYLISTTNTNRRLALEILMLEL